MSLPILYEDEQYIAIHKPAGLLVHRSEIAQDVGEFVVQQLRNQLGEWVYPIHRLDRPTAGVLVLGRTPSAAHKLQEQFAARQVHKTYWAVVRGYLLAPGRVDMPLKKPKEHFKDKEKYAAAEPQEAITEYAPLAQVELPYPVGRYATARYSLLALRPLTGRVHQLRRHLNHLAHPIVGDTRYGDNEHNDFFRTHWHCHRLLLVAKQLQFTHPNTQQLITITAPLDPELAELLPQLFPNWHAENKKDP